MDAKKVIVIGFFCITGLIIGWSTYQRAKVWWTASEREIVAEAEYHTTYWQHKTATIERNDNAIFYLSVGSIVSLVSAIVLGILAITTGKHRELVRRASVFFAKIGRSEVPVLYNDLSKLGPVYAGLVAAEQMHETAAGQTDSLLYLKQFADIAKTMSQGRMIQTVPEIDGMVTDRQSVCVPTFADLLQADAIAPGKPLILGFHQGQPEHRDIKNLKSVAVAGWQGSGKTSSAAYIIGSSVLAYNAEAFVIDPHKNHDEGLYTLIQPLESVGVTVINPFDTPALIHTLNTRLDRRLRGDESSNRPILFVIDELARLAKQDCFDELVILLERCTEETRKANIVFLGISTKWTARHFKGRADIRGCMNSALVHKCKPSQAELLLEDSQEKKLVEHLERPGDAILLTDYAATKAVSIPFCTRQDMETVAEMISRHTHPIDITTQNTNMKAKGIIYEMPEEKLIAPDSSVAPYGDSEPAHRLTPKMITTGTLSQREIARRTHIPQSRISFFSRENDKALSDDEKDLIYDLLFPESENSGETEEPKSVNQLLKLVGNQVIQ